MATVEVESAYAYLNAVHPRNRDAAASSAIVFQRFDIDLCAGGPVAGRAAGSATFRRSSSRETRRLPRPRKVAARPLIRQTLSLARLIQHIVRIHHQCVRQELPSSPRWPQRSQCKRNDRAPELEEVEELLEKLHGEMFAHIEKEEQVLFPFIAQMDQRIDRALPLRICFRSVLTPSP